METTKPVGVPVGKFAYDVKVLSDPYAASALFRLLDFIPLSVHCTDKHVICKGFSPCFEFANVKEFELTGNLPAYEIHLYDITDKGSDKKEYAVHVHPMEQAAFQKLDNTEANYDSRRTH